MNDLDKYVERVKKGDDPFLGRLCWYSITDVCVPHGDVIQALAKANIFQNLPREPLDDDVFRRVSSNASLLNKKVGTVDPETFYKYRLTEVGRDKDEIVRRLVRDHVQFKGRKLDTVQIGDVTYKRATGDISGTFLHTADPVFPELVTELQTEFQKWRGHLNSYAIREWIREYLQDLGATSVRPRGGLYFVKEALADRVVGLEKLVSVMPGSCEFHTLPLIDEDKQRDMLRKAFEAETIGAIDDMLVEMAEIMEDDKMITPNRSDQFKRRYLDLMGKTSDYQTLLETAMNETNSRLEIAQKALLRLSTKVNYE